MTEVISRRKVRTIAYLGVFMSQVISSTPLVRYVEKYASLDTLTDLVYINYAFPIPPVRK